MENLLAAVAEQLADDAGLARPDWTTSVDPLATDTFLSPLTPQMRERVRRATPQQFSDRRLFVDEESIWRSAVTAHAS